jgi:hypothetical protein
MTSEKYPIEIKINNIINPNEASEQNLFLFIDLHYADYTLYK